MQKNLAILKKIGIGVIALFLVLTLFFFILSFIISPSSNIFVKYIEFIGGLFTFKFGEIIENNNQENFTNVASFYNFYFSKSMLIIFPSFIICIVLGFIIGSLLGYIKSYFWNTFFNLFLYASSSIPIFVIAPLLLVFSEYINWPTNFIDWEYSNIGATLNSLIIPIALICLVCGSYFTIQVKNATSTILGMQYIKLAKVKGMNTWIIYWKYVFANSLIKFLHSITILYSFVLSFSLIIERVFNIPGQSIILLNAFREKETYLVLYFIFSLVISVVIIQILIETFLIWLNPQYLINQQKFKWNIKTMFFKRRKNG